MKKVSVKSQKFYSCFSGELHELFVVELDGVYVASFTHSEEAIDFARGFSVALKVCGYQVTFDCTIPIEL